MSLAATCPQCGAFYCTCHVKPWWTRVDIEPSQRPFGCICPPTSEQTCENPLCPRKGLTVKVGVGSAQA